MASKISKTNAARQLESLGIAHTLHQVAVDENDLSGVAMARQLGVAPDIVFKTLVARGDKTGVLMACIPADAELNLKALAAASANKHVEMVPLKDVRPLTGYVRGGCSPLGGKKNYPVYLDASALAHPHIYVSAGLRGVQIFLNPEDLVRAVNGDVAELARHPGA
ncbi:MAG: aminoacyl-tRNA deacylase [Desulfovibrio sp. MES5]|uniref:Cys-tRNA(Pro) deacylase n=1 Tax=Desulfovibrio sp. MES5 TaxID=1899016 RepID=UPI000B9D42A3|nr:Cys-tRNA(Pro) deacylase [Desulfovibrio sp. MES5]OXS29168.1 MAG: aminoacyl-tRNA deacylase [Desulfovibrio sp. MES5]